MKDSEIFSWIKNQKEWFVCIDDGIKVEFLIKTRPEEKRIYVLFQESNGSWDWKCNLNFPVTLYDKLKVHRGFAKQYDICRDEVIRILSEHFEKNPDFEIVVSGWSLGSAISVLACQDINHHLGVKVTHISFGVPKVCFDKKSRDLVRECINESREYCNRNDIVTYMPPIGYYHIHRVDVDKKINPAKIINPQKYHTNYDEVLQKKGL